MKHLFVSMSVKPNFFVSVFVHKCLMVLNDVEYIIIKMFVTQMNNYLFVISFQLMFYKTLRCSLSRPKIHTVSKNLFINGMFIIMDVKEGNFSEKTLFSQGERLMKNIIEDSSSYQLLMLVFRKIHFR